MSQAHIERDLENISEDIRNLITYPRFLNIIYSKF